MLRKKIKTIKMTKTLEEIYGINEKFIDDNIIVAYKGEFTKEIINALLSITKKLLHQQVDDLVIKKRVYNVLVECVENIYNYAHLKQNSTSQSSVVIVGKKLNGFYITGGNLIPTKDTELIKEKLRKIKGLKKEELKTEYKKILLSNINKEKDGASLGLIDMALKSNNLINYHFKMINVELSLFIIEIKIDKQI